MLIKHLFLNKLYDSIKTKTLQLLQLIGMKTNLNNLFLIGKDSIPGRVRLAGIETERGATTVAKGQISSDGSVLGR